VQTNAVFYASDATVVTVTYGERWRFLRRVLSAAKEQGASRAVVIDNGSSQDITSLARTEFGDFARVVRSEKNTGSAGGYRLGLETALYLPETKLLFLLDDDNKPLPGCLAALCAELNSAGVPPDKLAAAAFRPGHTSGKVRPSAYQSFRLTSLPELVGKRIWRGTRPQSPFALDAAPYGGLLFHKTVCERYGLPDQRLILYADDTEFTYRITRGGGKIIAVPGAEIEELVTSWTIRPKFARTGQLRGPDAKLFYRARNRAYFETHCVKHNRFFRKINGAVYLTLIGLAALLTKNVPRLRLLLSAIKQGEAGKLGEVEEFKL